MIELHAHVATVPGMKETVATSVRVGMLIVVGGIAFTAVKNVLKAKIGHYKVR